MMKKIRKAAVIGTGTMGSGIAALLSSAKIKVLVLDILNPNLAAEDEKNALERNKIAIENIKRLNKAKPKVFMSDDDINRIEYGNLNDDIDKLKDCDWIFEVAVEDLKIKKDLFSKIDNIIKEGTIISSNTSGIPLALMSEGLSQNFKESFLGAHFFNPVRYMRLVEIIKTKDTKEEVIDFVEFFITKILGKRAVLAKDTPNFIANRIGIFGFAKAMSLFKKYNLKTYEADSIVSFFLGRPKSGIFKTADLVGIDVLAYVFINTVKMLSEEEKKHFVLPDFINKMIENKLLGNKTKKGFYTREKDASGKKIKKVLNLESFSYEELEEVFFPSFFPAKQAGAFPNRIKAIMTENDPAASFASELLFSELVYAASKIPEIADTIVDIDEAMKAGYNFSYGLFETWDAIGFEYACKLMKEANVVLPDNIEAMLSKGVQSFYKYENEEKFFYDFASQDYKKVPRPAEAIVLFDIKKNPSKVKSVKSASLIDIGDDVFCIEFHTKMNSLNGEIIEFMNESLDFLETGAKGLVVGNQTEAIPGAFSAGADIFFILNAIKASKFSDIEAFIKRGQSVIQKARYSNIPIVTAPYGLALGGGCEISMGVADKIVAHADLYMGLVEVGAGLIPSGGGCLNLWRRFLESLPLLVQEDIDLSKLFIPVFMNIAMGKVSDSAFDARKLGFLKHSDKIIFNRDFLVGEAKKEVLRLHEDNYLPPLKKKIKVIGEAGYAMANAEIHNKLEGGFISAYDAFMAKKIAFVISGGAVRENSYVSEDKILDLERETFVEFCKEEKTKQRIAHLLNTGKVLRN